MPFTIVRNDIVNVKADAIVNSANPQAVIGSGVDEAIHRAAGNGLICARKRLGEIAVGKAAATPAFQLQAKYVIHTVGPVWQGGGCGEEEAVKSCYRCSLELAQRLRCRSIAFPLISTGNYRFPKDKALQAAIAVFGEYLLTHEMDVTLVVYDHTSYVLSEKLMRGVSAFIDDRYTGECLREPRYQGETFDAPMARQSAPFIRIGKQLEAKHLRSDGLLDASEAFEAPSAETDAPMLAAAAPSLDELVNQLDESFSQAVLRMIDVRGRTDAEVYKRANIDRKLFSKIRSRKDYKPSKQTALALAIALELDLDETRLLLQRAGFALSHSSKFDIIIEYFIQEHNYNIFELNEVLFSFDQPLLGG